MLEFRKYQATGNDFIIFNNIDGYLDNFDQELWQRLCHRRLGVGADGILFLCHSEKYDFKMKYLNADGQEVSMCGNGTRALSHYYHNVHLESEEEQAEYWFETKNGVYHSNVAGDDVKVKMTELYDIQKIETADLLESRFTFYANTGVEHSVFEVEELESFDVVREGRRIRNDARFDHGANANFFEIKNNIVHIRTYERGVEDETLSCGTGITATAIALVKKGDFKDHVPFISKGGELKVEVNSDFSEIYLCGKVQNIFEGLIDLNLY